MSKKELQPTPIPEGIDLWEVAGYEPSLKGGPFHDALARFRFLLWGIKGGKTFAGAHEFLEVVIRKSAHIWETKRRDKLLAWVLAPTHDQVATCENELDILFAQLEDAGFKLLHSKTKRPTKYTLVDGGRIWLRSAEVPENLRGPNVDLCWIDEGAFIKELAWIQVKQRIAARKGEVIVTTTPDGRNWVWKECVEGGMPPEAPYGEFGDQAGRRWVSHWPTWDFPWVDPEYVEDARRTMPAIEFDRDLAALFLSSGRSVFRHIEDTYHQIPLKEAEPPEQAKFVIGVDLAKQQDYSVLIVMDGTGIVWDIQRWNGIDYKVQKDRIVDAAKRWNNAVCMVDSANVGSSICDDLRGRSVRVHRVDMHSAAVKRDIIEALQAGFDSKSQALQIPRPGTPFAPETAQVLVDELKSYEASVTRGGKISYSAPKGMHDDCCVSLALAYWGKKHGHAGSAVDAATVAIGRDEFMKGFDRKVSQAPRAPRLRKTFKRSGLLGSSGEGPLWRR
jgi:hypothetical protein